MQGLDSGERYDLTIAYSGSETGQIWDHIQGEKLVAAGRFVHSSSSEGSYIWREDGPSFVEQLFARDNEILGETEPFAIPTSWFEFGCTTFRGKASPWLHYSEHQIFEQWIFDPADGAVLLAVHQNNLTGTDLTLKVSREANIPAPDYSSARLPAAFSMIELSAEWVGSDYDIRYTLTSESESIRYDELSIHLLGEGGEALEAISLKSTRAFGSHGAVFITDSGTEGVADAGDEWIVRLGAAAFDWEVYDHWASDLALLDRIEGEAATDTPAAAPPTVPERPSETLTRFYEWSYGGKDWEWTIGIPSSLFDYYVDQDFVYRDGSHAFDVYVSTPHDDAYIQSLADSILRAAADEGWTTDETLSFALSFVQALDYTNDTETTGFDEFPRYPIETLVDGGGDCEDTSILYAAIVDALGYGVVLVDLPGHIAVGVLADAAIPGYGYTRGGERYLYAETTSSGWRIGEIPDVYLHKEARLIDLEPAAILTLRWELGADQLAGFQHVRLTAANTGSAAARTAELWAGLSTGGGDIYAADSCRFSEIAPGEDATCAMWLRIPPRGSETRVEFVLAASPGIYVKDSSDVFTT